MYQELTLFPLPTTKPHPARYTDDLLPVMAGMLRNTEKILDPFGGTGKVFRLKQYGINAEISAIEIEPEWAA